MPFQVDLRFLKKSPAKGVLSIVRSASDWKIPDVVVQVRIAGLQVKAAIWQGDIHGLAAGDLVTELKSYARVSSQ